MLLVVPLEELLTEGAAIVDAETIWELWAVLQVRNSACTWRIQKSCGDWSLIQPSTMSTPPVGLEIDW
jgi:hypothetical protein